MALSPEATVALALAPPLAFLAAATAVAFRGADPVARAVAVGLAAFGAGELSLLLGGFVEDDPLPLLASFLLLAAGAAFLYALVPFPRPLAPAERGPAMLALGFATAAAAAALVFEGSGAPSRFPDLLAASPWRAAVLLGLLLLPIRYLGEGGAGAEAEQRATVAAGAGFAFLAQGLAHSFATGVQGGLAEALLTGGLGVAALVAAVALWLRNTVEATLQEARWARWAAVAAALALVLGLGPPLLLDDPAGYEVARATALVAAAGAFAYAFALPWREARRQG